MPASRRVRGAAATAAAEPRSPVRRASDEDSEDDVDHEDNENEEEEDEDEDEDAGDQAADSPDQDASVEARLQALERRYKEDKKKDKRKIKDLEEETERLRAQVALQKEPLQEETKEQLLEKFPTYAELEKHWRDENKRLCPRKSGAAKPHSLELLMEGGGDRTYTKLHSEGKTAQKGEYATLYNVYLWAILYADAISDKAITLLKDRDYEDHFEKLFNGLYAALEMASDRLSYIQVKTFPEEFDETFQQVVSLSINKTKTQDQLISTNIAALHQQYTKILQDKTLTAAVKSSLNTKLKLNSDKPSASGQGSGSKSDKKKPARRRPEERPAPPA